MRKALLTLVAAILVLGLFAATGYAGYRFGYAQGVQAAINDDNLGPQLRPFGELGPRGMHNFDLGRGLPRGFDPGGFTLMRSGFFSPLLWLGGIAVLGLTIGFIFWLLVRSDWRLTRQPAENSSSRTENE